MVFLRRAYYIMFNICLLVLGIVVVGILRLNRVQVNIDFTYILFTILIVY